MLFNPFGNLRAEQDLWRKKRKQILGLNQTSTGLCVSQSRLRPGDSGRTPSTTKTGSNATGAAAAPSLLFPSSFQPPFQRPGTDPLPAGRLYPRGARSGRRPGQAAAEGQAPGLLHDPLEEGKRSVRKELCKAQE